MTLQEACTLVVGILGDEATARGVHEFLRADGWDVTRGSVKSTLYVLRGATVKVTAQGTRNGSPTRYRQTEAARAWVWGLERT
jgi:hypothetical protein